MAESGPYIFTKVLPFDTLNGLGALFVHCCSVPGLATLWIALRGVHPDQYPAATCGWRVASRPDAFLRSSFRPSCGSRRSCRLGIAPAWTGSFMAVQALNAALFYTWHEMF